MEAINLYMKAGLPARAARLAMSREVSALDLQKYPMLRNGFGKNTRAQIDCFLFNSFVGLECFVFLSISAPFFKKYLCLYFRNWPILQN